MLGATYRDGVTHFRVWAPDAAALQLVIEGQAPQDIQMKKGADGFWTAEAAVLPGALYRYRVDGQGPFPDPASRFQPQGVHGPSEVIDPAAFPWSDREWTGIAMSDAIFYELHIGTFTREGTFRAAMERLPDLAELGITAVQLMPVADFPGNHNWGYDGVDLFAPARCYGSPDDLRAFVDRAHSLNLAVFLDVVYNHFGPDGAYQGVYSKHYFSKIHRSPWGDGINVDGPLSEHVRDYFAENAVRWVQEYHIDGLRLDATHAIVDDSSRHVTTHITDAVHESLAGSGRRAWLIAEDHRNLAQIMKAASAGGWGMDGIWADDFHHQMRAALAGDHDGYFKDFDGSISGIAEIARKGWLYCGQPSQYFGELRGEDPTGLPYEDFVFFIQNHDQIGNRAFGDRLNHGIDVAAFRAASALLLLLPETPLLFMGQEWGASSPFQYFTDHYEDLGRLVTAGRRREFARFRTFAEPEQQAKIPDPQARQTFEVSKLRWQEREQEPHASLLRLYRSLLQMRRSEPALRGGGLSPELEVRTLDDNTLWLLRTDGSSRIAAVIRLLGSGPVALPPDFGGTPFWSTEDGAFTSDAAPAAIQGGRVEFQRPGAILFRMDPKGGG